MPVQSWIPESVRRLLWLVDDSEAEELDECYSDAPAHIPAGYEHNNNNNGISAGSTSLAQETWRLFNEALSGECCPDREQLELSVRQVP